MAQKFKTPIVIEELAATSTEAFTVKLDTESTERIIITADGKMTWGSGAATGDTTLYRSAANTLKTDDTFEASAGLVTMAAVRCRQYSPPRSPSAAYAADDQDPSACQPTACLLASPRTAHRSQTDTDRSSRAQVAS